MKSFGPAAGRLHAVAPLPLVVVVAGTRPEAIKLAPLVRVLDASKEVRRLVVNSGQHASAVRDTFAEFDQRADVELSALPALPNLAASFGHLKEELAAVVTRWAPAVVVVQGDTLTAHAAAHAAHATGHRIAHVEAGLRTDSATDPFPEEWFRRRIARIADLHFAPTRAALANLLAEGVPASQIHRTGNTGIDSLRWALDDLDLQAERDDGAERVLVTLHRRENHDGNADTVCRALMGLCARRPRVRVMLPVHPNPRVAGPIRRRLGGHPAFDLVAPMRYREFIAAAARASLIISDSGGIQEEAPHLGTPLLVPRRNTERPEGIASGFVQLVRVDEETIVAAAAAALDAPRRKGLPIDAAAPFGAGDAARRIATVLEAFVMEHACA